MTLGFWYLFQESLWSADYEEIDDEKDSVPPPDVGERDRLALVNAVYVELVKILRSKVTWPPYTILSGWPKGGLSRLELGFGAYADVGSISGRSGREVSGVSSFSFPLKGTLLNKFSYRRDVGDTLINACVNIIDVICNVDISQILHPAQ